MRCPTVVLLGLMASLALAFCRSPSNPNFIFPPVITRSPGQLPQPGQRQWKHNWPHPIPEPRPEIDPLPGVDHNATTVFPKVDNITQTAVPKVTQVPVITSTTPPLPPFNPNPMNLPYLQSEIFLKELNEGRLDDLINKSLTKITRDSAPTEFGIHSCSNILSENTGLAYLDIRREGCPAGFAEELVGLINNYRARHQARPLKMKSSYNRYSQKEANKKYIGWEYKEEKCYRQAQYSLEVTSGNFVANLSASAVAKNLYSGVTDYHSYGKEPDGHLYKDLSTFTQLVWVNTTQIGVGCTTFHSYSSETKFMINTRVNVVVTFGKKPGNIYGEYATNVLPPNDIPWTDYKVIINEKSNMNFDN